MANNFAGDSNCVALWTMDEESGNRADSIGNNDLTDVGTVASSTTRKEGTRSADFDDEDANSFKIVDGSLDTGFPLKNGGAGTFSFCFWTKFDHVGDGSHHVFFLAKGGPEEGKRSLLLIQDNANSYKLTFKIGYNSGASFETLATAGSAMTTGRWYHITVTFDNSTKAYRMSVWDDTAAALFEADITGTATNNVNIEDGSFTVSGDSDYGTSYPGYLDGLMDEVGAFKDVLTTGEIASIIAGTYGASTAVVPDTRGTWRGAIRGQSRGMMRL